MHLLLKKVGVRKGMQHSSGGMDRAQSKCVYLERVSEIGLNKGKFCECLLGQERPPHLAVGVCSVRLPVLQF